MSNVAKHFVKVDGVGSVIEHNINSCHVFADMSLDINTYRSLTASRLCPPNKHLQLSALFSAFEVAKAISDEISSKGPDVYVFGNSMLEMRDFGVTSSDLLGWLEDVFIRVKERNPSFSLISDGENGIGLAVIQMSRKLGIPLIVCSNKEDTDIFAALDALSQS